MQILAVLLAAAACFGLGAIYYSVLSKPWLKAIGKTKEEIENGSKTPYIVALVAQIIAVGMMRHMLSAAGIDSVGAAAIAGAAMGAFIIGPWIFINNAYEGKGFDLSLINTGYAALGLGAAGAVLGFFL